MTMLTVEDLHLELRHSSRRRTLQLTVERDGELVVFAPAGCDAARIEEFVRDKRPWIYQRLAEKEMLRPVAPTKEYVSGEGFPYLGRSYRLLLVDEESANVKLEGGRFKMSRSAAVNGRDHMIAWYTAHARPWLTVRVQRFATRTGIAPSRVVVRDLGYRWGSCGKEGTIYFHWKSVLLPPRMVEYVVVHELAHLQEPLHSRDFWLQVERAMPDFAYRKKWLAASGHRATAI